MRIVTLLAAGLVACPDGTKTDSGTTPTTGTDTGTVQAVSLANDVLPIFSQNCAECHTRTKPPFPEAVVNKVYLEETGDILGLVGTFIIAGDSASSPLIGLLNQDFGVGKKYASLMPPPPKPPVSGDDIALFAQWIDEGAADN